MEVKPGYKQTEVGVIPKDWDVQRISEVAEANWGNTSITKSSYRVAGFNAFSAAGPDGFLDWFEQEEPAVVLSAIGALCGKTWLAGRRWTAIKNTIWIRGLQPKADSAYIFRITGDINFWPKRGQAQPFISLGDVRETRIPLPPLPEQRAIAQALSDVDALLDGLDRLIAKKRALKQAAMQQLLTGQTRLPGFHGEWEVKRLGELADIRSGGTPSTTEPSFWDGDIPWCTPTDITALDGNKDLRETSRMITQHGLKASSAEMIPARSVIMTSRATIGECAINAVPVSTNQGFKNFIPLATTDVDFLYYLLSTQKQGLISLCGGSTFLEIGKAQIAAYEVRLPPSTTEQAAIAEALTKMDQELAGLERRRTKTRTLKQAMMQELLTGRVRLVTPS